MSTFSTVAVALHALAAVGWVGGMFFAYVVLRPSLGALEGPRRLALWGAVLGRFFVWVWLSVVVLLVTGYLQVAVDFGGFGRVGLHIHIMHAIGLVMVALYVFAFSLPFQRFQKAVAGEDWAEANLRLAQIRRLVATNLVLGLITVAIGASGRLWG